MWCITSNKAGMYGHHIEQSMDQPGKVANPARGQLNRENNIPLSPCRYKYSYHNNISYVCESESKARMFTAGVI